MHCLPRPEGGERRRVGRQGFAQRHDARAQRLGGKKTVEMMLGCQTAEYSDRVVVLSGHGEGPRLPVAPCGFLRLPWWHRLDRTRDVSPCAGAQRGPGTPCMLRLGERRAIGVAIPCARIGQELARGVVRDDEVAVRTVGLGKPGSPSDPCIVCGHCVDCCDAVERIQRELASGR